MDNKQLIKELERVKALLYPFYSMAEIIAVKKIDAIIKKLKTEIQ